MVSRNVSFHVEKAAQAGRRGPVRRALTVASNQVHGNNAVEAVVFRARAGEIVCIAGIDGNGRAELVADRSGSESLVSGKLRLRAGDYPRPSGSAVSWHEPYPEDWHKHGSCSTIRLRTMEVLSAI